MTFAKTVPLVDRVGTPFTFGMVDPLPERLHQIDLLAGGMIQMPEPVLNPETRDRYVVHSLMEEAITSSQLEGAATTREVAKEMIRSGRKPRDRSERMILNNYATMQRIGDLKDVPLTRETLFELHSMVTLDTLDDPTAAGRFRREEEYRVVGDDLGTIFHEPPPADELAGRLEAMCAFANGESPAEFVHPAIRSMILHFWLAYDHPFVDGNGRTARALFYWSMLRNRYWLFEYISISEVLLRAPVKYGMAYLYTETDDNDLNYFLLHHVEAIRLALDALRSYIESRSRRLGALEASLRGLEALNHRQRDLIAHALRHPGHEYTIESHRSSNGVVYQTARTDLLDLERVGLLRKRKRGHAWHFVAVANLESLLSDGDLGQSL